MKNMTKKCPVCGEKFVYIDLRHIPETCGKKMCQINAKYRKRTFNTRTGDYQDWDKIKKF